MMSITVIVSTVGFILLSHHDLLLNVSVFQQRFSNSKDLLAAISMLMIMQVTPLMMFSFRTLNECNARFACIETIYQFYKNLKEESTADASPENPTSPLIVIEEPTPEFDSESEPQKDTKNSTLLEFQNVTMRYLNNPTPALNQVTFSVQAGEKIGIVGRTGSGKSSLAEAIYKLTNIETGRILINGIDQKSYPNLKILRQEISLIPQEPVLFSGSIRDNLKNDNETDEEILACLRKVYLDFSLDKMLENGGRNLAVGERQLLCIARALLRKSKIVIFGKYFFFIFFKFLFFFDQDKKQTELGFKFPNFANFYQIFSNFHSHTSDPFSKISRT